MTGAYGNQKDVFGKRSYEYAVGSIKASSHPPISKEKMTRLEEADFNTAVKLLAEYGYPSVSESAGGCSSVFESIEAEKERMVSFVREIAPDSELISAFVFEEDALNLKLYLKAKLMGRDTSKLTTVNGSISCELIEACVMAEDFSLLGQTAEKALDGICEVEDAATVSGMVDCAMFARAMDFVRSKHCKPLTQLFCAYGECKNRITAHRMRALGADAEKYPYAFLPTGEKHDYSVDIGKDEPQILEAANSKLNEVMTEIGYESGIGPIAEYYFLKKNEAAALRLLFAQKQLEESGGEKGGQGL